MKKHLILAAMAMTALFTACNNDDSTPLNEETVPVSFTIGGIDSRATLNNGETNFAEGDKVGVFATENAMSATMNNALFTVNSAATGLESTTQYNYVDATTTVTFSAYYPQSDAALNQDGKILFSIGADQTGENFVLNDFMTATNTGKGTAENANVTFAFTHQLAFVELTLTDITDATEATLTVPESEVLWTPLTNTISKPTTTNGITVKMYKESGSKFYALIPAQTTGEGNAKFVIKNTTNQYTYNIASNTVFTQNKKHSFSLKKAVATLALSNLSITPWGESIVSAEDADYEATARNYIVMPTSASLNSITSRTDNKITTAGNWGIVNYTNTSDVSKSNTGTANYDSSTNTITFNYSSLGSKGSTNWYRFGLMYNLGVIPKGYTGTLSMKIKAENSENTAVANAGYGIYLIYGPNDNGDHFYGLTSGSNIYVAGNWTVGGSGETTRTVTVNMSKYYTGTSTNDVTSAEGSSIESNTKNAFLLVVPRDNTPTGGSLIDCSTLTYKISNMSFTLTPVS